ncbi:MAG: glycosyltransferase family 39 protein [Candidatus Latescibacterota bacterium]
MGLGLGLRLWGIGFGLPNLHCRPDESTVVNKALAVGAGQLNPGFFNYPSFHFYLLAAVYGVLYLLGRLCGLLAGVADAERLFVIEPQAFYLVARVLTALLGSAAVVLVYLMGRHLGGRRAGLLSATFLSVAFLHVRDSHFATVDVPATTYALAGCLLALHHVGRPSGGAVHLSAVCFGLAVSTKYSLAPTIACLLAAIWLTDRRRALYGFVLAGAVMAATFLVTTPFAALEFRSFWRDLAFERAHFASGHAGLAPLGGVGWLHHLRFSLWHGLGFALLACGIAGAAWMAWRRQPASLCVLGAALAYFAVAGGGRTVFVRYALPLVPFLCVAAGLLVSRLPRGALLVTVALAAPTALASASFDRVMARTDTRVLAAQWLEETVPDGAVIAMCGSDYGYPQVRLTREWLRQELEDVQAAGLEGSRLKAALGLEGYPPPPSYRVLQVRPEGALRRRSLRATADLDSLRREGVEWVVVHEHPLVYSRVDTALARELAVEAALVKGLDPFARGAELAVYDPQDAFYVPLAGFGSIGRPGPAIRIYRLRVP